MTTNHRPIPPVPITPTHRRSWRTLWRRCSCGLAEPCVDRLTMSKPLPVAADPLPPTTPITSVSPQASFRGAPHATLPGGLRAPFLGGFWISTVGGPRTPSLDGLRTSVLGGLRTTSLGGLRTSSLGGLRTTSLDGRARPVGSCAHPAQRLAVAPAAAHAGSTVAIGRRSLRTARWPARACAPNAFPDPSRPSPSSCPASRTAPRTAALSVAVAGWIPSGAGA